MGFPEAGVKTVNINIMCFYRSSGGSPFFFLPHASRALKTDSFLFKRFSWGVASFFLHAKNRYYFLYVFLNTVFPRGLPFSSTTRVVNTVNFYFNRFLCAGASGYPLAEQRRRTGLGYSRVSCVSCSSCEAINNKRIEKCEHIVVPRFNIARSSQKETWPLRSQLVLFDCTMVHQVLYYLSPNFSRLGPNLVLGCWYRAEALS